MANGLPVSSLINVDVILTPAGASFQNIDSLLILGASQRIDDVTRIREYGSITEVAQDFQTTDPEYLAATLWFGQSPQPTSLLIGAWEKTAPAGQLFGGALTGTEQLPATWNAVTTGSFEVAIDGVPTSVTGMNFSAAANMNAVAAIIQAAIRADGHTTGATSATVVWSSVYENLQFTSGTTGPASSVGFINPPTATGSFTFAGQPAANDTIDLNGTTVTFVAAAPGALQVLIGADLPHTLVNLLTFLDSSVDTQLVKFTYSVVGSVLYVAAATPGVGGDSLTIARTSAEITVSGATLAGATGTDISAMTGATSTSSGAYEAPGIAAETALQAVELFDSQFSSQWYGLFICGASDSDHLAVAGYIEADSSPRHFYWVTTQEAGVLVPGDTSDIAYQLMQLKYTHTAVQYSSSNPYAAVSMAARILTTNWQGSNTTITLMYKQEPGVVPESLGTTQANACFAKNCSAYVNYNNGTSIIQPGVCCSGDYIDTIIGLDWLANQIQTNVYNLLYTSTTKIPQTDPGEHQIALAIEQALIQGVDNDLLAPGTWNSGGFGNLQQGDFLKSGYYIYQPPVATQPENLRAARQSVPFQVAAKLAGAVQEVSITVNVNQ